jgi:hypothetical protein
MLAVLITLTPGRRNEFIDCPTAKFDIAALPIMDVNTRWNSTLEWLERVYRLWEFAREWLQNTKYSDYQPLFTTQDEWTIVKYNHGSIGAILILDPLDVGEAYSYIASHYYSVQ